MIGRRYKTSVVVLGGPYRFEPYVTFDISSPTPREAASVESDLSTCKQSLRAAVPAHDKVTIGILGGADPALVQNLTKTYKSCMEPRGYLIDLWSARR